MQRSLGLWEGSISVGVPYHLNSSNLSTVDRNLPANAEVTGSISCPGRFHMPQSN